ncbi:ABC transporter substrate-binding protein [Bacillus suaedaesalsae]|uniref:ABC transporter substrate-binding protein n=1 Tax=Bacillus suaedaesalsae TaxID=2810349 RepID=A0ABS2DDC0_9BACI|nr:ABC transporter substrate-binding protein [Bacillus suaedaesalsae]MBM6616450.1 ABC transporter substrate-binding protein [Bacillus suaedaesalsae]
MSKKLWLTLLMAFMLVLGLAACGGGEESTGEKEPDKTENTDDGKTDGDTGTKSDTLVFGRGGDSVGLDPITVTDGESFKVTKNVFDTLVDYGQQDTEIEPALATEWTVSPDGLVYTFKLREGVKFHDGTDFNAEAVKFNFDRWANGDKEAFYYYGSMFGGFAGDEAHVIKEVKAVDPTTVEITLTKPVAPFLKNLAMSPFGIASPTAVEKHGDKFTENPVGTGPFVFVEWKRNERVVIEKNPNYWKEGYPKLNKVIFVSIPDNTARLNALLSGEIHLADGLNNSDVGQLESSGNLQAFNRPSMNVGYLGLTNTRGPLKDKKVRQALNHAVDKQGIIDAFYAGQAVPAINPMPDSIGGYNDAIEDYPYDLEKAKALLAEAGYADGFEMELWAMPVPRPYMPDGQKVAEVIQASFEQIGVKAKIVTYEWATYLDKARLGEADAFLLGWTGDNGDADNFLNVLLGGSNIDSNNYARYDNAEVNKILAEAQSTTDEAARNDLYKQAQELIKEDAPWIPLVHSTPLLGGVAEITGFYAHPTGSDKLDSVEFK